MWPYISAFQFPHMFFKIFTHRDTGSSQRKTSLTLFFWSSESRCSRKEKYLPSWPQDMGWALPALSTLGLNPCQNCVRLWISSIHLPQSLNDCSRRLLFLPSEHTTSLAGQQNISRIKFYNQSLTLGWHIVLNNSPILTHLTHGAYTRRNTVIFLLLSEETDSERFNNLPNVTEQLASQCALYHSPALSPHKESQAVKKVLALKEEKVLALHSWEILANLVLTSVQWGQYVPSGEEPSVVTTFKLLSILGMEQALPSLCQPLCKTIRLKQFLFLLLK